MNGILGFEKIHRVGLYPHFNPISNVIRQSLALTKYLQIGIS
jgi:hypothetical protein